MCIVKDSGETMSKFEILGYFFVFVSMSLSIGLYKLELSKHVIDEEYEYIKKHRAFGNLTKYLTIIAIVSAVLLNCKFLIDKDYLFVARYGVAWSIFVLLIMCTGFYQKRNSLYYKRGFLAICSILFGMAGLGYALKHMFFN